VQLKENKEKQRKSHSRSTGSETNTDDRTLEPYYQTHKTCRLISDESLTFDIFFERTDKMIIVSLTSYAARIDVSAYRAVVTLLDQDHPADKVVLWVEADLPIPKKFYDLRGLEIKTRRQRGIESHSKLIWSLQDYPKDIIVTADDDIYYPRDWLKLLLMEHEKHPAKIICHFAHEMLIKDNYFKPYIEWPEECFSGNIFPLTGAGCLFPPHSLYHDVTDTHLIMTLCPQADDVWFWAMAVLNGTDFAVVPDGYSGYRRIHSIVPHDLSGGEALYLYNVRRGGNDIQLKQVFDHYPALQNYLQIEMSTKNFQHHLTSCPVQSVDELYQEGLRWHRSGALRKAASCFQSILQRVPEHSGCRHFLGIIAMSDNDHQAAVEHLERAVFHVPDQPAYLNNYGVALRTIGRHIEAETAFQRAVQLEDTYADGWSNLGFMQMTAKRYSEAERSFRKALFHQPDHHVAMEHLGDLLWQIHCFRDAIALYRQVLNAKPNDPEFIRKYAEALAHSDCLKESDLLDNQVLANFTNLMIE